MHLVKIVFSFLAVGGAAYALIRLDAAPAWLKAVSLTMAFAALIIALPHLPQAIDALGDSGRKIAELFPSPSLPRQEYVRPWPAPEPRQVYTPPLSRCAAIAVSNRGAGGWSHGAGTCVERLQRARILCEARTNGQCGGYAHGPWVAAVHCIIRNQHGYRQNSFAGWGTSEHGAFDRAFAHAASQGFHSTYCSRKVAVSAERGANRY